MPEFWPGGFGRWEFIVCHRKEGRLYMIIKCAQLRVVVSISTRGTRFCKCWVWAVKTKGDAAC